MEKCKSNEKKLLRERKIKDLNLPFYTVIEEVLNSVSHGIGAVFAVLAMIVLIMYSPIDPKSVACLSIYSCTLLTLYIISTLYHAIFAGKAKKIFQTLDHCSIFILIAGTYTPICLIMMNNIFGLILSIVVWMAAIVGIVLNLIDVKRFSKVSMACYIGMGWVVIFAFKPLIDSVSRSQMWLLIYGGIAYTVGAIIYALGKRVKYMHAIWHIFVLLGSGLHFAMIFDYVNHM